MPPTEGRMTSFASSVEAEAGGVTSEATGCAPGHGRAGCSRTTSGGCNGKPDGVDDGEAGFGAGGH
jgi:hypothetical protein